jgi:hypothetical protein
MSKPEIKYNDIPDEEIMTSESLSIDKRYWHPKMQKSKFQCNDTIYIELKNYLINFYNTQPKTQFLYWAPISEGESNDLDAGNCPITIEYLNFVRGECGDCGIICEIAEFGGNILINDTEYEYEGHTGIDRWCERDYLKTNTKMSDIDILDKLKYKEILFKLYVLGCPNVVRYRNYTTVNDFRLKN